MELGQHRLYQPWILIGLVLLLNPWLHPACGMSFKHLRLYKNHPLNNLRILPAGRSQTAKSTQENFQSSDGSVSTRQRTNVADQLRPSEAMEMGRRLRNELQSILRNNQKQIPNNTGSGLGRAPLVARTTHRSTLTPEEVTKRLNLMRMFRNNGGTFSNDS